MDITNNMVGVVLWSSVGIMWALVLYNTIKNVKNEKNAENVFLLVCVLACTVLMLWAFYIDIGG